MWGAGVLYITTKSLEGQVFGGVGANDVGSVSIIYYNKVFRWSSVWEGEGK